MDSMGTLYDILGVTQTASHDQIKAAYRKRAGEAHPDRGGSEAAMAELNRAWECLGDPQKRIEYDKTGQEGPNQSIEDEARTLVMQVFGMIVADDVSILGDVLAKARDSIKSRRENIDSKRSDADRDRKALERHRDKVRLKGAKRRKKKQAPESSPRNLFHMVIDAKIKGLTEQIEHMGRGLEVFTAALRMLDDYESDAVPGRASIMSQMPKMRSPFVTWNFDEVRTSSGS